MKRKRGNKGGGEQERIMGQKRMTNIVLFYTCNVDLNTYIHMYIYKT